MSRIGRQPIVITDKVKVKIEGAKITIDGPLGSLSRLIPAGVNVTYKDNQINLILEQQDENGPGSAIYGTTRALVQNMATGVLSGFTKILEIHGVGFRGQVEGTKLTMQLGFSHPVVVDIPQGIKMSLDPKQTILTITGINRETVGTVAAKIKKIKPPEPYKGTGIRYQGERIVRKAGKTAAGAGSGGAAGAKK